MNTLASALGKKFIENKEAVRTRQFTMGGHTFKVKVPLTAEYEAMQIRMQAINEEVVEKYYKELIQELEKYRENPNIDSENKLVFTDNDVIVDGRSMREAAKNKAAMETRITEMFKLLVPEDKQFDMSTITYAMVDDLFPLSIQMQVIEEISRVVAPGYEETKGK